MHIKRMAVAALLLLSFTTLANGQIIPLEADLFAPNQNGTNPVFVTDPLGVVPTMASGTFSANLDLAGNQLTDIEIEVFGLSTAQLQNFGPNSTPFHLHLPNSGSEGDFGFNVVDLVFGADPTDLFDTTQGFSFTRDAVSILEADQGAFAAAGVHPGDDVIADRLLNAFPFIAIHTTSDIFTASGGTLPNGNTAPDGFPFVELRGEVRVAAVPEPSTGAVLGLIFGLTVFVRRRSS